MPRLPRFLPVTVTVAPDERDPAVVASYFTAVARRLDARPQPMCLAVDAPRTVSLGLTDTGKSLVVRIAQPDGTVAEHRFSVRRRWIPEHPVPLAFPATLAIRPVEANRFRVRAVPRWLHALSRLPLLSTLFFENAS